LALKIGRCTGSFLFSTPKLFQRGGAVINEREVPTTSQRLLDLIGMLLRGLGAALGWVARESEITIRLFGNSPMLYELALAIFFTLFYHFPAEETMAFVDRIGTGLAVPFVLGAIYATLNAISVAHRHKRDVRWYWALFKAFFPAVLAYLIFANQAFHRLIGWGDPASALRFCAWLVWLVVLANVGAANLDQRTSQR